MSQAMQFYKFDLNKAKSIPEIMAFIRHQLGEPVVKVEITDQQILENIYLALDLFLTYAVGLASEEMYYALMLRGGQQNYQLDDGVLDVLDFTEYGIYSSGINTLFTLQNQMSMTGLLDFSMQGENTLLLLNYHLVLDFIETIQRYSSTLYQHSYDPWDKVLTVTPPPKHDLKTVYNSETHSMVKIDSPGWVMLKVKQFIGAGKPGWTLDNSLRKLIGHVWVRMYALALCKLVLGRVRIKFHNYASIGNTGIALDGSDLLSEGQSEKEKLEKQLIEDQLWTYTGYGITTGIV